MIPVAVPVAAPPRAVNRLASAADTARERAAGSRGSAGLDNGASGLGYEGGAAQV